MTEVYLEWERDGNISLIDYQDQVEKWWDNLTAKQKYDFFPWATGFNYSEKVILEDEYIGKFEDLLDSIQEEIVEKYVVQNGLVNVPEGTNLPHWELF